MSNEQLEWIFAIMLGLIAWFSASTVLQYQSKKEAWTARCGAAMETTATTMLAMPGITLLALVAALRSFFYTGVEAIEGSQS